MTVTLLQSEDGDTLAPCWPQPRSGSRMLFLSTCAASLLAWGFGLGGRRTQVMLPEQDRGGPSSCCRFGQFIERDARRFK